VRPLVGVVERTKIVTGERVRAGDRILGLASGGLQTNGFSLARHLLAARYHEPLGDPQGQNAGQTVGDALLAPHRSFLAAATPLLEAGWVRGMAHITGGGLPGNLPRVLPAGLGAEITPTWPVPEIFRLIETAGRVARDELFSVFNMGVGFVFIVAPEDRDEVQRSCPDLFDVGTVVAAPGVRIV
jgi:phosphoribosylformylglycinamidine cyclo-ligase